MSRPKVKICGLTDPGQAKAIAELGADALGFILYPKSPRYIEPDRLAALLLELPPFVKTVGVFVDEPLDMLVEIMRSTGLNLAQLHGAESPEYAHELTRQGIPWIKALRVGSAKDLEGLAAYGNGYFLLDAKSEKGMGGTGETFDWSLAKEAAQKYRIILAGGLSPDNLAQAITQVSPYGLDISSGVEVSPGVKDLDKVAQVFGLLGDL